MTKLVSILVSVSTKELLDTYKMNQGKNYDEIIRKLVFCEKLDMKLELFEFKMEVEDQ